MDFLNGQNNYQYPINGYYNYNTTQAQPQANYTTTDVNQAFSGIFTVNGEYAAKNFPVARGVRVLLMDTQNDVFYVKSTDINGVVNSFRTFDYTERTDLAQTPSESTDTTKVETQSAQKEDAAVNYITKKDLTASVNRIMDYIDSKLTLPKESKKK